MIDLEEIRKTVAVRNNFLIGEDDPLLVLVTMNDLMLEQQVKTLNAQNAAALDKAVAASQKIGEKIIAQGADYVSKQAKEAITESLKEAEERINKKVIFMLKTREEAVTAKQLSLYAAGMSLFFMFVTWGALIGRWFEGGA